MLSCFAKILNTYVPQVFLARSAKEFDLRSGICLWSGVFDMFGFPSVLGVWVRGCTISKNSYGRAAALLSSEKKHYGVLAPGPFRGAGARVQGWESVCCRVPGIPLLEKYWFRGFLVCGFLVSWCQISWFLGFENSNSPLMFLKYIWSILPDVH